MEMCTVLRLHFLVYLFHGYVPCSKVTVLSFMDMYPALKLHFLVCLFHGYESCSKVTLLSVSVS